LRTRKFSYRKLLPLIIILYILLLMNVNPAPLRVVADDDHTQPAIRHIAFVTPPRTLTAGVASEVMRIQIEDLYSNGTRFSVKITSDTTISLHSTSGAGKFSLSTNPWGSVPSVTIRAGSSSAEFYYNDTAAGTPIITAAESPDQGWMDARQTETVNPAELDHFTFAHIDSPQIAGTPFSIEIRAKDIFNNDVTEFTGNVALSDLTNTITPTTSGHFAAGVWGGPVNITAAKAGVTIKAKGDGKSGESNLFDINPATAHKLVIIESPLSVKAGTWTSKYTVARQDRYGNNVTSGPTIVNLESNSPVNASKFSETEGGSPVTSVTISDGRSSTDFYYYDQKAGEWMISVSSKGLEGFKESLTVTPGDLYEFVITGCPQSTTAGQNFGNNNVTVIAYDAYGNPKTDYTGSIYFKSTDPQALLLYNESNRYRFTVEDKGQHEFSGSGFTLKTSGNQRIMVTDGKIKKESLDIKVEFSLVSLVTGIVYGNMSILLAVILVPLSLISAYVVVRPRLRKSRYAQELITGKPYGDVGLLSDIGGRNVNEDSLIALRSHALLASGLSRKYILIVADGMGGYSKGKVASTICVKELASRLQPYLLDSTPGLNMGEELGRSIDAANDKIYALSRQDKSMEGMGTTVTTAFVDNQIVYIANVGDSRTYVLREGAIHRITRDHSIVQEMVDRGELTEEQARHHPKRNIITRVVGYREKVLADLFNVRLQYNDRILLCTDGLHSSIKDSEIQNIVRRYEDPQQACLEMVKLAKERGASDNLSVILVRLN